MLVTTILFYNEKVFKGNYINNKKIKGGIN